MFGIRCIRRQHFVIKIPQNIMRELNKMKKKKKLKFVDDNC